MKYYYNGKLIRTSDRIYEYAVIDTETFKVYGCSGTLKGAESQLRGAQKRVLLIKSLIDGTYRKRKYWHASRKEHIEFFVKYHGSLENALEEAKEEIKNVDIVKLEMR